MAMFGKVNIGMVEALKMQKDAEQKSEEIKKDLKIFIDNQNQQIQGLVSVYNLLVAMAKHQGMKEEELPKPLIKMECEYEN